MGACTSTPPNNSFEGEVPSFDLFEKSVVLGEGSFGTVVCCRRKGTEELVAIKIIKKARLFRRTDHSALVWNERDAMIRCGSPFMVHLLCSFHTADSLYMVMPFHLGGDLNFRVRKHGPLPMQAVRFYLAEILAAIQAMHDVNVCHRDIKPDNVLIDADGHVSVTDLGLAIEIKPQDPKHASHWWGQCGSYGYRAPEVVLDEPCGFFSDIYSLGATTYFLLYGRPPWAQTKLGLEGEPLRFPSNEAISPDFIDLIIKMLVFDSKERITIDEIHHHPVFKGVNWDLVYQKSKKSGLGKPPIVPNPAAFEFPTSFKAAKNVASSPLSPEQQARFVGFEWVPGDPITGGHPAHFSRSNEPSPRGEMRDSVARGSVGTPELRKDTVLLRVPTPPIGLCDENKMKAPDIDTTLPPTPNESPHTTSASIPAIQDNSTSGEPIEVSLPKPDIKEPTHSSYHLQEPFQPGGRERRESFNGTFPGAHSPHLPVRRMKFKHLRFTTQQQDHSAPRLRAPKPEDWEVGKEPQ
jgi:serine/threonine protein kinase